MNTTDTTTIETTCACGRTFHFEPVFFNGERMADCDPTTCPDCQRTEAERHRAAAIEKAASEIRASVWRETPPIFRLTDLAHPRFSRRAWQALKPWRPSDEKPWLGLIGPTGTGKTRLAYLLAADILAEWAGASARDTVWRKGPPSFGFCCAYQIAEAVIKAVTSNDRETASEARAWLRKLRRADLLLVDDLGKMRLTPAVANEVFALLDQRHQHCRATIWTSNSAPEHIAAGLSEDMAGPLAGRLNDASRIFKIA